jgi:O-antigen/teichoic acid export membrane protein
MVSSLTNVALTIMVARSVSADEFGTFSLLLATYLVCVTLVRGLTSEPLLVRFSAAESPALMRAVSQSSGATVVAALLLVLVLTAVVLATGLVPQLPALIFLVTLPGLLLQDHWRYALLAAKEPHKAFVNDVAWALAQLLAVAALALADRLTLVLLVLAWGAAANVAALVGLLQVRVRPRVCRAAQWLREQGDLAGRYAAEGFAFQGANQATVFVVAAVAGLAAAGSLRAAQTLFGPLTVLTLGIRLALVPEAVRAATRSLRRMRRLVLAAAALLTTVTAAWSVAVLLLPDAAGEAILGSSWALAVPLLVYVAVDRLANATIIGPFLGLRALADSRRSLRARVVVAALTVLGGVIGAVVDGARGAAIGAAGSSLISIVVWSYAFFRALAHGRAVRHDEAQPAGSAS